MYSTNYRRALAASASGVADESVPEVVRNASREQLEVVFLGTGAAIPAKYRNVSGIFVNLFSNGGIMLDCGETLRFALYRSQRRQSCRHIGYFHCNVSLVLLSPPCHGS